jgi:glycosyltransferase involved in cell wall biosynthesis
MRTAWVLYGDLDAHTGGTIYDRIVVDGLRAAGDDVHVVSLDPRPRLRAGLRLAWELTRLEPDVVVGDELCFRELAVAFPLVRRPWRVLLVHHLTSWERELGMRMRLAAAAAERVALRSADRIVVTSESTKKRLERGGVIVARPGCDRLALEPARRGTNTLLFVGAIIPRKRVLDLVRAFGTGAHASAKLVLAGSDAADPEYARSVSSAIAELGLGDRVSVIGEIDDAELARRLATADALVLPSRLEGWGIAATEAFRAGTPVIASGATAEALASCTPAVIFFGDVREGLVDALSDFTRSSALRRELAVNALAFGARLPTWASCIDAFRRAAQPPDG